MTSLLIRKTAKDIAGAVYDHLRMTGSERFARENPSEKDYIAQHWVHCVKEAKKALTELLMSETTLPHEKEEIYAALLEDFEKSDTSQAMPILQFSFEPREKEDVKHIDATPELPTVGA